MTTWTQLSAPPSLAPDEVHLWRADLLSGDAERLRTTLSPDELDRADRFISPRDGQRYVHARGTLRALLAAYEGKSPAALAFRYGAHGKPELPGDDGLRFNLSHSGEVVVFAFARVEVGVDVERVRDDIDVLAVAARAFPPHESARLQALPHDQRCHAFFAGWTRLEARLKAVGSGWSAEPGIVEDRLTVHPFECDGGFLGALAVAAVPRYLRFFDA